MNNILRVFFWVRRYPRLAVGTLLCAILSVLCGVLVYPQALRHIFDDALPNRRPDLLLFWTLAALGAYFARDALNAARIILNNIFEQRVIFDLRSDLYARLQKLPLPWFDHRPTGDIMTTVAEDVTAVERVLIDGIEQGAVASLQVLIVGGVLFWTNPVLAGWALLPLPVLAVGALIYTNISRQRHRAVRKAASAMNSLLMDNLSGIRQIKAYTREEAEHLRFNTLSEALRQATLRVMTAWATYQPSMAFTGALGFVLVLWFGGKTALAGTLSPGELTSILFLLALLYEPIGRLHTLNQIFQAGRAAAERVFDILDSEEEEPPDDPKAQVMRPPVFGQIEYRHVNFSYNGRVDTLKDVSLQARPGETVALVGATGAGKSTIINLLCRFYDLSGENCGDILLDGYSIRDITKTSLRGAIGYVTQESFLFNGTVRDNLLIARPQATDAELWQALEAANAQGFVERLPEKLDTEVGERGVRLSVGEKQRLSIARALLKNPPILLLDEATASVDTETERQIQEALDRLMKGRTCFVIAHRLSTVRHADRIYVLERGRVVQEGTHDELLADEGGIYAELCRHSFLGETGATAPQTVVETRVIERIPEEEQARLRALEAELAGVAASRSQYEKKVAELEAALAAREAEHRATEEKLAALHEETTPTAEAIRTQEELRSELAASEERQRQLQAELEALRLAHAEAENAPAAPRSATSENLAELESLRARLADQEAQQAALAQELETLRAEKAQWAARASLHETSEPTPTETSPSKSEAEARIAELQAALAAREAETARLKEQAAREKKHLSRMDRDLAASEEERLKLQAALEELKAAREEWQASLETERADQQAQEDTQAEEFARQRAELEATIAALRAENEELSRSLLNAPAPSFTEDVFELRRALEASEERRRAIEAELAHQAPTETESWQARLAEQERRRVLLESELALVRAENERLSRLVPARSGEDGSDASHPELPLPIPSRPLVVFTSRGA